MASVLIFAGRGPGGTVMGRVRVEDGRKRRLPGSEVDETH